MPVFVPLLVDHLPNRRRRAVPIRQQLLVPGRPRLAVFVDRSPSCRWLVLIAALARPTRNLTVAMLLELLVDCPARNLLILAVVLPNLVPVELVAVVVD